MMYGVTDDEKEKPYNCNIYRDTQQLNVLSTARQISLIFGGKIYLNPR